MPHSPHPVPPLRTGQKWGLPSNSLATISWRPVSRHRFSVFLQNVPPPSPWFLETGEVFKILHLVLILSCLPTLGRKDLHPSFKIKRAGRDEWVPKPSGERGQAGYRPANDMKPHTVHCFDYLKLQHLGKQMCGKGIFLGFPEGVWARKSFKDTC